MISKLLKTMKTSMEERIQDQPSFAKGGKGLEMRLKASVAVRS